MNRLANLYKMLEIQPEDVFLNYALAMELISLNNYEESIHQLEWLQANQSDYLPTYYQLAAIYIETEQVDKAINIYKKGMDLAKVQNETKTFNELKSAYEELIY
jgi:tetratricopeptide (TPR) repeat protein